MDLNAQQVLPILLCADCRRLRDTFCGISDVDLVQRFDLVGLHWNPVILIVVLNPRFWRIMLVLNESVPRR